MLGGSGRCDGDKTLLMSKSKPTEWGSPAFDEKRILFAIIACKSHLNFFPIHPAMVPPKKDTVQFPYDKRLPKALILACS